MGKKVEEKEENIDDLINQLAVTFINENRKYVDKDVADSAIKKIENKEMYVLTFIIIFLTGLMMLPITHYY